MLRGSSTCSLFLVSQLKLLSKSPNGRRYSSDLLILSFTWKIASTALYKILSQLFFLPTIHRLQQISTVTSVHPNEIDLSYMSARLKTLSEKEKIVLLMQDKVYTSTRVEYQSGAFVGLADTGEKAKRLLVFMIHSLSSHYKDVVELIPIYSLKSEVLKKYTDSMLRQLHEIGFHVAGLSSDNHAVNR